MGFATASGEACCCISRLNGGNKCFSSNFCACAIYIHMCYITITITMLDYFILNIFIHYILLIYLKFHIFLPILMMSLPLNILADILLTQLCPQKADDAIRRRQFSEFKYFPPLFHGDFSMGRASS